MKTGCQTTPPAPVLFSFSGCRYISTSLVAETSEPWLQRAVGGRTPSDGPFLEGLAHF